MKRRKKQSFQQKMLYGLGALFAVSLLAFLPFMKRSYQHRISDRDRAHGGIQRATCHESGQCSG